MNTQMVAYLFVASLLGVSDPANATEPELTATVPLYTTPSSAPPVEVPAPLPRPADAPPAAARREVQVTARGLNVRTAAGEILCSVPHNAVLVANGRHGDGERIRVEINARGCPRQGFVYASYVRPRQAGATQMESQVDTHALSLRSRPTLDDNAWKCALPKNTKVIIQPESGVMREDVGWVRVQVPRAPRGCPQEGFLAEAYLKSSESFRDLPLVRGTRGEADVSDCSGPGCRGATRDRTIGDLEDVSKGIGRGTPDSAGNGPFIDQVKSLVRNPRLRPSGLNLARLRSRTPLVQMPLRGNRGPCGSFQYNPKGGAPNPKFTYANPLTACVFTAVLQDWKKNYCPDFNDGCRVAWGDISHRDYPRFNGHQTHTDGYCIDIRPMREGGFTNSPLYIGDRNYDREKMRQFVSVLRKFGGSNFYFNDRRLGLPRAGGHDNHIHVCFKDNPTTRNACNNLQIDPNVCPELQ